MASRILLIIAHGSRSLPWNLAIETFCHNLQSLHFPNGPFGEVRWCFLEHAQPSIQESLRNLCQPPTEEIIALPLFLSVGQHVAEDIPMEVNAVANIRERREGMSIYDCRGSRVWLLDPPPTCDLLSDNLERRVKRLQAPTNGSGLIVVYYGAQKHIQQWDHLANHVQCRLQKRFPHMKMDWGYGGDAVDFSPIPLAKQIEKIAQFAHPVILLPALVATGVVQNEIIPAAISPIGQKIKIIYPNDAILPDTKMEQFIANHAQRFLTFQP